MERASRVLRDGGVLLYPTDTVWGLGCDATNEEAVKRVLEIKGQRSGSLIVLVEGAHRVGHYVKTVPEPAWDLIEVADKPTTLILPDAIGLAKAVPASDGSVGMRVVQQAFCQKLIGKSGRPLVSTSANRSGGRTPASWEELDPELKAEVDHVVDPAFEDPQEKKPSSLIRIGHGGEVEILRR